ncbi:hypothetical protein PsAD2_00305 [Pseudovibrio axinellae]|uniref:Uncharacterized protein n=1 Tax=Pseudovibrio axinellae TaxID=989403 RepID=A0A161VCG7_9HYPH|nr:hypothetical protein PsAD2_00305 [Pseudovibrio axinellae]SEQ81917.1 hypothetical protein SAMN05421798_104303 [Pseudovibrio axinellae]
MFSTEIYQFLSGVAEGFVLALASVSNSLVSRLVTSV